MTEYVNEEMCAACGGQCCKRLPGIASPEDFSLPDTTQLIEALKSGKWAVDWWEGNNPLYFVRPATKDAIGELFDPSWGGECVFLTEKGCSLPHDQRPSGCRLLEPKEPHCIAHGAGKEEAGLAWEKYNLYAIAEGIESCTQEAMA